MMIKKDAMLRFIKEQNMTMTEFAKEIGMPRSSVSRAVHGRANTGGKMLEAFAKRFPDRELRTYFLI